jgi:hypothetical protein
LSQLADFPCFAVTPASSDKSTQATSKQRVGRSNILIDKDFRDLLPKGAGNFEGQTQVGVKSALFNGVDRLTRHADLGGELGL